MSFEDLFREKPPMHEAAAFFISVREPTTTPLEKAAGLLDEFWGMPREEQRELLKEAGVTAEEFGALLKFAASEVDVNALLGEEQEAMSAQRANESSFYQSRAQEMQGQVDALQQQLQMAQEQSGSLQQQVEGSTSQIQQAQQDAQLTQQSALTNMQSAQAVATQAMQQAVAASDEALKAKQMAAQMRMSMQGMRGEVMNVISQDPAADVGAQLTGAGMETPPPTAAPPPSQGVPGGATTEIAPPPTEAAPPSAEPPTSASAAPAEGGAQNQEPTPPATKEGSAKTRAMLAGGALGALVGGGATALEAHRGHDDLRSKVRQLENAPAGGFGQSVNLTRAKTMLAAGELAEKHPVGATLAGSLMGAGLVGGAAPELVSQGRKFFGRLHGGG